MNYAEILKKHDWLVKPNQNAIISFDIDGLATGILLATKLNWNIVGYYDSANLILKKGINPDDCIFVDVEIFRNAKRSVGHHLIVHDFDNLPSDFSARTERCFNPNFVRKFDKVHHYTRKYPFATYHLFDKLLRYAGIESINATTNDALSVIWFIDGVMNVLYRYKENVAEWIDYMQMQNLFWYTEASKRSETEVKEVAERFISEVRSITNYNSFKNLNNFSPVLLEKIINLISVKLGVESKIDNWCFKNYNFRKFDRQYMDLNRLEDFNELWSLNPISISTYFQDKVSFTLDRKPEPKENFPEMPEEDDYAEEHLLPILSSLNRRQ